MNETWIRQNLIQQIGDLLISLKKLSTAGLNVNESTYMRHHKQNTSDKINSWRSLASFLIITFSSLIEFIIDELDLFFLKSSKKHFLNPLFQSTFIFTSLCLH